jgi:hypothetical protein
MAARHRGARLLLALAAPTARLWLALPGLIGLALLSYGAWMAFQPAGFIVPGVLLLADKIATERKAGGSQ